MSFQDFVEHNSQIKTLTQQIDRMKNERNQKIYDLGHIVGTAAAAWQRSGSEDPFDATNPTHYGVPANDE